jgi:SP family general alpha glucoside:H+ symporter-like MFS transporter
VPETMGRTYAELDELYERRIPAWRFSKEITSSQEAINSERDEKPSA